MATQYTYATNPAVGDVPAQNLSIKVPEEGKYFKIAVDKGFQLAQFQGGKIVLLNTQPDTTLDKNNPAIQTEFQRLSKIYGSAIPENKLWEMAGNILWEGKTQGQWQQQGFSQAVQQLGLDPNQIEELPANVLGGSSGGPDPYRDWYAQQGIQTESVSDIGKFVTMTQSYQPNASYKGATEGPGYDPSKLQDYVDPGGAYEIKGGVRIDYGTEPDARTTQPTSDAQGNVTVPAGAKAPTLISGQTGQPIGTTAGNSTDPAFVANSLSLIYSQRGDLQELYNPDGTAKDPNDPRVAGIPTLLDWARQYGYKEDPRLAGYSPPNWDDPNFQANLKVQAEKYPDVANLLKQLGDYQTTDEGLVVANTDVITNEDGKSVTLDDIKEPITVTANAVVVGGETFDIDEWKALITANDQKKTQIQNEILKYLQPTPEEIELQKALGDIDSQMLNTQLQAQAGILDVESQAIAMKPMIGQANVIMKQANLQLQTLAAMQYPLIKRLELAQSARNTALTVMQTMYGFLLDAEAGIREDRAFEFGVYQEGQTERRYQQDAAFREKQFAQQQKEFQLEIYKFEQEQARVAREEQRMAAEWAAENGVDQPFFVAGGTVYRSSDMKAYHNPAEAAADGVNTATWDNVFSISKGRQDIEERKMVADLAFNYIDAGISMSDSFETASAKVKTNSAIYREKVRPPQGPKPEAPKTTDSYIDSIARNAMTYEIPEEAPILNGLSDEDYIRAILRMDSIRAEQAAAEQQQEVSSEIDSDGNWKNLWGWTDDSNFFSPGNMYEGLKSGFQNFKP